MLTIDELDKYSLCYSYFCNFSISLKLIPSKKFLKYHAHRIGSEY